MRPKSLGKGMGNPNANTCIHSPVPGGSSFSLTLNDTPVKRKSDSDSITRTDSALSISRWRKPIRSNTPGATTFHRKKIDRVVVHHLKLHAPGSVRFED